MVRLRPCARLRARLRAIQEWERERGKFTSAEIAEAAARAAGILLGKCSMNPGAVDASVAEGALRRGDAARRLSDQEITTSASHRRHPENFRERDHRPGEDGLGHFLYGPDQIKQG
jgi:hypothetical protein